MTQDEAVAPGDRANPAWWRSARARRIQLSLISYDAQYLVLAQEFGGVRKTPLLPKSMKVFCAGR